MVKSQLSIIIVTYNRHVLLRALLEKLRQQEKVNLQIIVADDGSSPAAFFEHLIDRYIWRKDDGFNKTELLNLSAQISTADNLLFIDDDCVPYGNLWAASHLETLGHSDVSIGGIEFYKVDDATGEILEKYPFVTGVPGTHFTAVNVGIRKDKFDFIGRFDAAFNGNYGHEDTDLGLRIQKHRLNVGYTDFNGQVGHFGKFYSLNEDGTKKGSVSTDNYSLLKNKWKSLV
jgi:glycosyltransferase involved in cell wall biosynthesis